MTPSPEEVSQWLIAWSSEDQTALDKLMPLVYDELHRLAHHYMSRERPDHTLQTTALVHEAYLRWNELLVEAGLLKQSRVADLLDEANQILSITVSSINTARGGQR